MEPSDFPGNRMTSPHPTSQPKPSDEEKDIKPVVTSEVIHRKKSLGRRIKETFTGGETDRGVLDYVFFEVALPAAKDLIFDAFTEGLQRQLFPDRVGRRGSFRQGGFGNPGAGYVSYQRYSAPGSAQSHRGSSEPRGRSRGGRGRPELGEIVIPSRVEAMDVLDRMSSLVDQYQLVSVADLFALLNEPVTNVDYNWGWTTLYGANAKRVNGGYLLVLPPVEDIK